MQPKKIDSQAFCEGRDRKVRKRSGNFLENLKNGLVDATLSFRKKRAKNKAIRNAAKRTSYDRANIAKAKSVSEVLATAIRQMKEITGIKIGREVENCHCMQMI